MKDFLGRELIIGDTIVACVPHGRNSGASLVKGTIVGFTEHFVKSQMSTYNGLNDTRKIHPEKVLKV